MNDLMRLVASSRPARLDENEDSRTDPASIMAHPRRPAARPASRRRLVVAAAAVVAGAVIVGGAAVRTKAPLPAPNATGRTGKTGTTGVTGATAPTTARGLLLAAAEQTTHGTTSGRYWRTELEQGERLEVGPAAHPYALLRKVSQDHWLPIGPGSPEVVALRMLGARPAGPADQTAWKADGSPRQWRQGDVVITMEPGRQAVKKIPEGRLMLGGLPVTNEQLAALTTSEALRKFLLARADDAEGPADYLLFVAGETLVTDLPVSPAVRAAGYRMLADLPGVRLLGDVRDQHGRAGVAVGYLRNGSEARLIVDANGGQALARESWHGDTLLNYQVILSADYTDAAPPVQ